MTRTRRWLHIDAIGSQLTWEFTGIALIAVALLAGLTAVFAAAEVSQLTGRQRAELTSGMAVAAAAAYETANGWEAADLAPVLTGAAGVGAELQIRDSTGQVIATSPGFASHAGAAQSTAPVLVQGRPAGVAVARFTGAGLSRADHALLGALLRAISGAAGLAVLLALGTGLIAARRISRPVDRLIAVTRKRGRGERSARAGPIRAPSELRELATAFDQMADSLDRQEQSRRDLVADVAHELRTPIAILQAGHEAMLDEVTEPSHAQLASLHDEVLRLGRMVADLQTLAATEADSLRLTRAHCDLADIAADAADSMAERFQSAGITVRRQLTPVSVTADSYRLHQVITNLLSNALKFTTSGGSVTISAGPAGGSAVLEVIDTGAGIPASELPHIFERFWRGQEAAQIPGSGIGLAVAAELTRAHGGQITAVSELGQGTRMTVTLPRA